MQTYVFEGQGRVNYDPHRGTMRGNTKNWCVIDCDREITRYNRWWLNKEKHLILNQPAWDAHISVVRGERLSRDAQLLWKKYHGKRVDFMYEHGDIQTSPDPDAPGTFFWVRVHCPLVDRIRSELGLRTSWKTHHMTIGRTYY